MNVCADMSVNCRVSTVDGRCDTRSQGIVYGTVKQTPHIPVKYHEAVDKISAYEIFSGCVSWMHIGRRNFCVQEEIGVEELDGDVRFYTGNGNMTGSRMRIEKWAI